MTREQIEQEYHKLMREHINEIENIIKDAKEAGTLEPGLDGNRELFKEANKNFLDRVQALRDSLVE